MSLSKQGSSAGFVQIAALVTLAAATGFGALRGTHLAIAAETLPDGTPSPQPSGTMNLTYDSVCADLSHVQDKSSNTQIQKYCDAASAAEKAQKAEKSLFMVYGGVAGICAASCVVTMTQGASPDQQVVMAANLICTGSALGGAAMDAMKTKNYQSAMQGMMGAAGGLMMGGGLSGAAAGGGANMASCMSAMVAGGQMYQKKQAADEDQKKVKQNLESAASLKYAPGSVDPPPVLTQFSPDAGSHALNAGGSSGGAGGTSTSGSQSSSLTNNARSGRTDALCSAGAGGNGAAAIQCALAYDKNLPGALTDPRFGDALNKISGKSADAYLSSMNNGSPASALANNMGGVLNATGISKLEAAFRNLEDTTYTSSSGSYAAGGGGSAGAGSAGADSSGDMSKAMADLMNGMKPGEESAAKSAAVVEAFGERMRKLASVQSPEENRGISLFERVSSRYYIIDQKQAFSATIVAPRR